MQPDVAKVWSLWDKEQARDGLLSEWRALHQATKTLQAELTAAEHKTASSAEAREGLQAEERRLNRKLESYQTRAGRAKKSIEIGMASDYRAAMMQAEQCSLIADEVETELLELMERIDEAQTTEERAKAAQAHLVHRLESATSKHDTRLPILKPEFEEATERRDAAREGIWRDLLSRYDMLRTKKVSVFAKVKDQTCGGCHCSMDGLRYSALQRDTEVVYCRHCGRFLRMAEE